MTTPTNSQHTTAALRVAVLTRTGRPSGAHLAQAVAKSRHTLCGILAERRASLVTQFLRRQSGRRLRSAFGLEFWRNRLFSPDAPMPALRSHDEAQRAGAAYTETASLNAVSSVATLKGWAPDVLVVANAPLLKEAVFRACRIVAVNFHSGRLPEFGGLESEFWALYEGEAQAWVTLHELRSDLDSGDILAEQAVPVVPGESPQGLHRKCIETARTMLPVLLDRLAAGDRTPVRVPGPARLRPWPTNAQRHELRLRDR